MVGRLSPKSHRPTRILWLLGICFLLVVPQIYSAFRLHDPFHGKRELFFHDVLDHLPEMKKTSMGPRPSSSPYSSHFSPLEPLQKNESFGACLMIKEDNDLLYEWLAYHFTRLPLRYVYVGSDEGNLQNPNDVLNRWKFANTGLQYWIVGANDFIHRHNASYGTVNSTKDAHHAFLTRQRAFITTCTEFMKSIGLHWVIYTDSDEFVVTNHLGSDKDTTVLDDPNIDKTAYLLRQELPKDTSRVTVLDSISKISTIQNFTSCYTMPRVLYGALENASCPEATKYVARDDLFYNRMSTLRFHQHAKKGDFSMSKYGKVIMDVSRLSDSTISRQPRNIHRPYKPECRPGFALFPNSLFYLNHYLGSWERYSSRKDNRRNMEEWKKRASITTETTCDHAVYGWFDDFLEIVGVERANFLLGQDTPI